MGKRLMLWAVLLGLIGTAVGAGTALADGNGKTGQCPITKRCPCGR